MPADDTMFRWVEICRHILQTGAIPNCMLDDQELTARFVVTTEHQKIWQQCRLTLRNLIRNILTPERSYRDSDSELLRAVIDVLLLFSSL